MNKEEFVNKILEQDNTNLNEEELMTLILHKKVSHNTNDKHKLEYTRGQKLSDNLAKVAGSWTFISIFLTCLVLWMITNALILTKAFDPFPFILLNLILSCVAAIQAPIIMMSQNRQEQKDRLQAENDYIVNLKTEIIIEDLYHKVNKILDKMDTK